MNLRTAPIAALSLGIAVSSCIALDASMIRNAPFTLLLPAALLVLKRLLDLRFTQTSDILLVERRTFLALKWAVLPVGVGLMVGSLAYQTLSIRIRVVTGVSMTIGFGFFAVWLVTALLGRLLARYASDGTRWRGAVYLLLVGLALASAAIVARAVGGGWIELPSSGAAVSVGGGWTMRRVLCDPSGASGPCPFSQVVVDAANYESMQPGPEGGGAVVIVELARGATRQYEPLRGRRAWVAARRAGNSWRVCSGGAASGPCVEVVPRSGEPHPWDNPFDPRRVVGDIPRSWLLFPLLGALAALALLRAAAGELARWRGVREGEHTGDGWVRWPDGTSVQVPNARELPQELVVVREHRRSPDAAYRGGEVIECEIWSGPLAPRLRLAAGRADVLNALALLAAADLGAPCLAALLAVW